MHKIWFFKDTDLNELVRNTELALDNIHRKGWTIISNQHMAIGNTFMFIITGRK